ncbi:uncharacterized protein LOC112342781 [Selaginella moellendorffii]|uniref:uncharacterized protein LOC112342781 n=1 Tax=Selaginella moellendorffii TaxID=88036 RepID=UPI000D1CC2A4|nr:uncharacterized protein LOC112342781 [Selaginella moellendorffii]XP_024520876.1 uncharacterized protein LOC112342781 [Selaginella moellendorffii]|eukprot:XP_024520875.1 uncharacterized protein LOC112342781 [Selaginella moellendorffii]
MDPNLEERRNAATIQEAGFLASIGRELWNPLHEFQRLIIVAGGFDELVAAAAVASIIRQRHFPRERASSQRIRPIDWLQLERWIEVEASTAVPESHTTVIVELEELPCLEAKWRGDFLGCYHGLRPVICYKMAALDHQVRYVVASQVPDRVSLLCARSSSAANETPRLELEKKAPLAPVCVRDTGDELASRHELLFRKQQVRGVVEALPDDLAPAAEEDEVSGVEDLHSHNSSARGAGGPHLDGALAQD